MAAKKKSSKGKVSKKLESFNRTQKIYQILERGIIESEALLNSAADRPDDDAHISDLLESTSGSSESESSSKNSAKKKSKPKKMSRKRR